MAVYACDQCGSDIDVVTFEGIKTYICPICSEVSFEKIYKKSSGRHLVMDGALSKKRNDTIKVGDRYRLENVGFVKIVEKGDHFLEFEEADSSVTSMSYEEFQNLIFRDTGVEAHSVLPDGERIEDLPVGNILEEVYESRSKVEVQSERMKSGQSEEVIDEIDLSSNDTESETIKGFSFDSLESVRKKLIDLTNRNNLLNYRHPRASCLRIIDELPDQVVDVLSEKKSFTFIPVPEPTESELIREGFIEFDPVSRKKIYSDHPTAEQWARYKGLATSYDLPWRDNVENGEAKHLDTKLQTLMYAPELESRCRSIRRKSETAIEESGANILYLILGFLEWRESRDSEIVRQAPLFTLPVRMERKKFERGEGTFRYTITLKDDGLLTNVPLREKLANDFGLNLPELVDEEAPEDYFEKVSRTILEYHPNWKLRRQATLALLNFSKQVMYEDLNPERWPVSAAIQNHPIIQQFFSSAGTEYSQSDIGYSSEHEIDKIKDIHEHFPLIYEADSSQHSALIDAADGKNLVIEGPPGSGKSQTITNLIAASIANGKKVLFVAEKMAALDVVKNRMDRAGLGDFCLELHSHKTQKLKILDDLTHRVNNQDIYRYPSDIDTDIARYEDLKVKLQRYVEVINQPWKETGLTIHEILNRATRYREELGLNPDQYSIEGVNGKVFTPTKQKELFDQAEFLAGIYDQIAAQSPTGTVSGHYWYGSNCTEILGYKSEELFSFAADWTNSLSELASFWETQISELQLGLDKNSSLDTICEHAKCLEQLPQLVGGEPLGCVTSLAQVAEQLPSFFGLYQDIHKSNLKLSEFVEESAIGDPSEFEKIKSLTDILLQWNVPKGMTLEELNADLFLTAELVSLAEKIEEGFSRITERIPASLKAALTTTTSGLSEFLTLVSLIDRLPTDLWRSRDELYDDNDLDPLLEKLNAHLHVLTPLHARLIDVFSLHRLPNYETLAETWSEYKAGGFFRSFSSKWRHARKTILSLAASKKINKKEVFDLIPELIEYVIGISAINDLNQEEAILGDLFCGVETPLERILAIRTWYKEVRREYGQGFGERVAIGDALLTLDRNIAAGILDYAKQELQSMVHKLVEDISRLQQHYPGYELLNNKSAFLSGEQSALSQLIQILEGPMLLATQVIKLPSTSHGDLVGLYREISGLYQKSEEWSRNPFRKQLRDFDFELSVSPGAFSVEKVEQGQNLCKILQIVNGAPTLQASLLVQPDVVRYEALRSSQPVFEQILSEVERTKEAFYQGGKICEREWYESSSGQIFSLIEKNKNALFKRGWFITWIDYIKVKKRLTSNGLESIIEQLEQKQFTTEKLNDVLLFCVNHQLSQQIFTEYRYLTDFSGLEQNVIRKKFREYDHRLQRLQQEKIAFRASRVSPPAGVSSGKVSYYTEMGLVRQEMGKRKRHIAVRSLMKRAGNAIQALKPCFMMSPMSVAQYLEPGCFEFDLVVMDEASQIKPEDALGSVARGKSFVVVGDPKQLPPTSFFQKIVNADSDEDVVALEESESILDSVTPMFKNRRLRWHYRSRHESLIAFSNQHFYDSNLILFPSPFQRSAELGIRYVRLKKGRFHNRRNVEEAKAIVEQLEKQIIEYPDESVGIVAMNSEQRDEIELQLDQQLKDNGSFRNSLEHNRSSDEPLFIKNLENVQGDERDVIFISMTYGPEQIGGRPMQRFGPINSDVGWRRLNVLFTRSKKRMRVFSSMGSSDILVRSNSSRGVKSLRAFLEYCESDHLHQAIHTGKVADSDFEIAVMSALLRQGYECEPQLGVAGFFLDLAVRDPGQPGRFLMGIECDGATYHSAKSARDRDRLRQDILEGLGWNISRIWSTDWFKNPEACLYPIIQELNELKTVDSVEDVSWVDISAQECAETGGFSEGVTPTLDGGEDLQTDLTLKDRLIEFRDNVIDKEQPEVEPDKRILRPAMLDSLMKHQPFSKGEFLGLIPGHLRSGTEASQGRYIGDICGIIADYGI